MNKENDKAVRLVFTVCFVLFFTFQTIHAQSKITFQQKIFVLKTLIPDLKTVGVIGSSISESEIQNFTRAGMAMGIKIVIGVPQNLRDASSIYKKMVKEQKIQVLDIPKSDDTMLLENGYEFFKENSVVDKVGLSVPTPAMVGSGALCSIVIEDGKIVAHINKKLILLFNGSVPNDPDLKISFLAQ